VLNAITIEGIAIADALGVVSAFAVAVTVAVVAVAVRRPTVTSADFWRIRIRLSGLTITVALVTVGTITFTNALIDAFARAHSRGAIRRAYVLTVAVAIQVSGAGAVVVADFIYGF
jgi:hypothetical protein